jgi:DNA-binding FadR family transcriptional regulator
MSSGTPRSYGKSIEIPKAAALVARALREQIVRGEIPEGSSLPPEAVLTQQFGVSRPTLREAFRILESERLVTVRRGAHGGATVHPPRSDLVARYAALILQYRGTTLADVYEARVIVEPACVRLVATNHSDADIALLRETVEKERNTATVHDLATKAGFHRTLVEMSGNQTLILLNELIRDTLVSAAVAREFVERDSNASLKDHSAVVDLIERGDGEGAQEMWHRHLEQTKDRVLRQLGGGTTVLDLLTD